MAERQHGKLEKGKGEQTVEGAARKVYESDTNLVTDTEESKPMRT